MPRSISLLAQRAVEDSSDVSISRTLGVGRERDAAGIFKLWIGCLRGGLGRHRGSDGLSAEPIALAVGVRCVGVLRWAHDRSDLLD